MEFINSILETVGNTPLLKLNKIGTSSGANVFVKLEYLNPSGSYKDRMAIAMIEAAEKGDTWNKKKLKPGGTVVEASSGNTAPALALACAVKGYKAKIILYRGAMPDDGDARLKITQAYGPLVSLSSEPGRYLSEKEAAELIETEKSLTHVMAGKKDCSLEEELHENTVWLDQAYNDTNYLAQIEMGREIYRQLDGKIDAVGCSIGSGAALYGMCLGLEEKGVRPSTVFGIVPEGSEHYLGLHGVQAAKGEIRLSTIKKSIASAMGLQKWVTEKSILEKMVDAGYPDTVFCIGAEEARTMANRLCSEEGIYCGMSSGANVAVALKLASQMQKDQNVVTVIVDRRDRYLSEYPHDKFVV